jgi:hypothetical protein
VSRTVILAFLLACLVSSPSGAQPAEPRYDPAWHGGIAAAALLSSVLVVVGERDQAPVCRWCGVDTDGAPRVPRADAWAWRHWHWKDDGRASAISHGTVAVALAWPTVALTAVHDGFGGEWGRDEIVATECTLVALLAADAAKRLTRRARPGVVFNQEPIDDLDDVHSFFSSHAATAFAAVAAAGTIASRRHSDDAPWIWIGGLGLAGTTAYLRVAATRHYLSDVLLGSAVGTAIGMLLPRAFDEWHVSSSESMAPAPQAMAGIGPVARVGTQSGAATTIQFAAGVRRLGIVGTMDLR